MAKFSSQGCRHSPCSPNGYSQIRIMWPKTLTEYCRKHSPAIQIFQILGNFLQNIIPPPPPPCHCETLKFLRIHLFWFSLLVYFGIKLLSLYNDLYLRVNPWTNLLQDSLLVVSQLKSEQTLMLTPRKVDTLPVLGPTTTKKTTACFSAMRVRNSWQPKTLKTY
jgi:hypothetical protein